MPSIAARRVVGFGDVVDQAGVHLLDGGVHDGQENGHELPDEGGRAPYQGRLVVILLVVDIPRFGEARNCGRSRS